MIRKLKPFLLCSLLIVHLACQKPTTPNTAAGESAYQRPTATEIFNLRTKCAELGDKLLRLHPVSAPFTEEQASHYDSKTNRCYVDLFVTNFDREGKTGDYASETVFDGQSREELAGYEHKKGKTVAFIKDGPMDTTDVEARAKIKDLMADDRKQ